MNLKPIASNMTELSIPETHSKCGMDSTILFSYETPVAARVGADWYRTDKKWSRTTSKHINKWLDGITAESKPQSFFDALV